MLSGANRARLWVRNLFPGWWVLAGAVAIQVLPAGFLLQAYSAYVAVMQPEFGWSTTAFAAAFSLQQAASGFFGPLLGWLLQRYGPRRIIRIGLLIFALGLALLSRIETLSSFYIVILVAALGASMGGFLSTNTVVVNWFERRRSTALSLINVGISAGGLLVPLTAWSLVANGWRTTALASAVLVLVIGLPLTLVIRNRPEDLGLTPDGDPVGGPRSALRQVQFSALEALRTRAFWYLGAGHALALATVFAVLAHLVVYLSQEVGFSLSLAASMLAAMTVATIAGQLLGGFLGDRFDKRLIAIGATFGHASALLILAYGATLPWVIAFAVVQGLSWGLRGPIMQALRADYFGRRDFAQIMGLSAPLITLGMVAGPLIVGLFADSLGSFKPGFAVVAGMALLGSVFFMLAKPPRKETGEATS